MLTHTFCYIPRKGKNYDRLMAARGLGDWRSVMEWEPEQADLKKARAIKAAAKSASEHLDMGDVDFFAEHLPPSETWLLFPYFRDSVCYLDIETTGMGKGLDYTTVATIYDGKELHVFEKGKNMARLPETLERYKICVTFNGKCFDVPVLRYSFPNVDLDIPHFDLRYGCAKLKMRGGLKPIERMVGISRDDDILDVDGEEAVRLWKNWARRGDSESLRILTEYNRADTVNLEALSDIVYGRLVREYAGFKDM